MITLAEACILGVLQGLTEFLPVSSDGHLAVAQHFMTPLPPEQKVAIDVALHLGTLVAVLLYFRADLWAMAKAAIGRSEPWAARWVWLIALATVPVGIVGVALKHQVHGTYESLVVIGACFLLNGGLLYLATAVRGALRPADTLRAVDAVVVGVFQVFALLPGVSRSGTTIAGGLFRRIRPDVAARFSFLMSVPAIVGAEVVEARTMLAIGPAAHGPLLAGIVVAAATGVAAIWIVMRLVQRGRLHWFAYYTWGLGLAVLALAMVRS